MEGANEKKEEGEGEKIKVTLKPFQLKHEIAKSP
jgi:hypothetical protein